MQPPSLGTSALRSGAPDAGTAPGQPGADRAKRQSAPRRVISAISSGALISDRFVRRVGLPDSAAVLEATEKLGEADAGLRGELVHRG